MQPLLFIFVKSNAQLGKMGHLAWGIELYGQGGTTVKNTRVCFKRTMSCCTVKKDKGGVMVNW
jgi:hypothetical protein